MSRLSRAVGVKDFQYPSTHYPAAKVDRVLHDGDQVRLGRCGAGRA